jgi:hypothetical protein
VEGGGSGVPGVLNNRGMTNSNAQRSSGAIAYRALIGLTTLGVLLQGVWAGIFLSHDHRPHKWIEVHQVGGQVTTALAVLALVAALVSLRARRDLLIGTGVLVVALVVEVVLGFRITQDGNDGLTAVHVPLALLIMALAVWLPVRDRSRR